MKMEGSVGSGVLKKKSSSGCLIIKKKGLNNNSGGGGLGSSSESSMGKKRVSLAASDSSDEDESLEFMRRKVYDKRLKNGSMGCKRSELETRDNAGIEDGSERKRSRLDLFEFDEYDEFDGKKMRNEFFGHKLKACGGSNSYKMKESGVSFKRNFAVDKGSSRFDGSSSGKSKEKRSSGVRNKELLLDDDEAHMPISLLRLKYQETAAESIRLQGKNGVLKVMVNKKKKEIPTSPEDYDPRERKERKGSRSDDVVKKESLVYSDSKKPENRGLMAEKERSADKRKKESIEEKVKPSSHKGRKVGDSEVDGVDTVLKLGTPRLEASSSKKRGKKEAERSPSVEHDTPVKGKEVNEGSAKRGGSTEKQLLREKIRGMLIDAGWTIDYRPRRNRDYYDAVYINPSGTAYWSIVKAYDAFKKQLGEDNGKVKADIVSPSIAPLSEDLVNKLTRNTKKKIAEANKRKRKEDGMTNSAKRSAVREVAESSDSDQSEERLSSFIKHKQKSRGKSHKVDKDSDDDLSDEKPPTASKFSVIQGGTNKVTGRCTLLVRGSNRDENSELEGYASYSGKRTVLAWLIDSGTAKLSEKVQYRNRRRSRVMLEGWITRDGIHCGCCSKILTVSKFELHAGSKLRQPFQNIFLESGSSLLQCQIDAWNNQEESVRQDFFTVDVQEGDPDDDTCGICGDGGDLICCDSCPSTFHQICLGIQMLPLGDWHCPNCACKFCGNVSGCAAEENNSTADELYHCHFCEKKYHKSCSERVNELPQSSNSASFCGLKCQEIYDHLEKILGIRHELEAGISWSLIQRKDVFDTSQRGFPLRVECNAKLAVASSVMDECFLPIIDRRSGINMINNVIYNCGSNFNRLNFCRFYTAILERGDEIISAASIRLHGDRLAEMPFIGTRDIYRRQGMCRRLLSAIETELRSLKVRQLIIPAISEHMNTWSAVFGFHELNDAHKKEIKTMNMLVFPGTDMLQKQLVKHEDSDGTTVSVSTKNQRRVPLPVEKGEVNPEQKEQASSDSEGCLKQNRLESNIEDEVPTVSSDAVCEPSNTAPNVYVLTKNQHQVPVPIEKGEVNPTLEQNEQASSDSEGCLKQNRPASNIEDEVPGVSSDAVRERSNTAPNGSPAARESDVCLSNNGSTTVEPEMRSAQQESSDNLKSSAVPAIPSDATLETNNAASSDSDKVCESNVHLANEGSTAFEPEMKTGQKESLDNLQISPPAENSCISDKEPGLLKSPAKENSSACKNKAPCAESVPVSPDKTRDIAEAIGASESSTALANTSHSMKVSEDAEPSLIVTNGCVESHPGSASEFSSIEETTSNPQNCAPISTHPDDEENTAAPKAVLDNDQVNTGMEDPSVHQVVDGDNETTDCQKVNSGTEDPSVDQVADGDNETTDCHKVNSGMEDPSVDQVADGDNETTDCHKVNSGMEDPSVDQVLGGDD